jgi:hypothetical protein
LPGLIRGRSLLDAALRTRLQLQSRRRIQSHRRRGSRRSRRIGRHRHIDARRRTSIWTGAPFNPGVPASRADFRLRWRSNRTHRRSRYHPRPARQQRFQSSAQCLALFRRFRHGLLAVHRNRIPLPATLCHRISLSRPWKQTLYHSHAVITGSRCRLARELSSSPVAVIRLSRCHAERALLRGEPAFPRRRPDGAPGSRAFVAR